MKKSLLLLLLLVIGTSVYLSTFHLPASGSEERRSNLLLVLDGLRPDYITPELMPNLYALGEQGVFADRHTAAFPSATRVNSASISAGSYPATHGLMQNQMFLREMGDEPFSTGSTRNLTRLAKFTGGRILSVPTLGEALAEQGLNLFVVGSGGSGNSRLQNPEGVGMGIWTASGFFVPRSARQKAVAAIGELPDDDADRTVWSFDAYLHKALGDDPPDAVIMWIHETDGANHAYGVGSPEALGAATNVDAQIGRLVRAFEEHDLSDRVNIFVTADHGFSTNGGEFRVARTLRNAGFSDDEYRSFDDMVFLERQDPKLLARLVRALQRNPETGNIYTRPRKPGSSQGIVAGTLSTAVIQWDHERAADVIVTPAWSDNVNEFGFPGVSNSRGRNPGSHGSDSPYDMQILLIAAGPDIKRRIHSTVPSGNVDLAPTLLHVIGIAPPPSMTGRVLHELLRDGPAPEDVVVREQTHRAGVTLKNGWRYVAELDTAEVGSTVYIRGSKPKQASENIN